MALTIKEVKFTAVSKRQLENLVEYLVKEFGYLVAEKFIHNFENKVIIIGKGKVVHSYFLKSKKIRYFILSKKNLVLYKELPTLITIIGIYSTKQNMATIKKRFNK